MSSAPPVAPASMDNPLPGDVPGAAEPVGSPKRAVSAKGKSRGEVGGKKSRKRDVGKRQNGKRSVGKAAQRKTGYSKAAAAKHKSGGKAKSNKPLKKRKK
ncbi:hypothetical protein ACUHMQ_09190 [Chitinimonas sp. PSY-7]|uniref:hypothetical protein n=1 Tax=Chitinimonas sp. PSY-7 TaxID=3459088 RepID=UPI00403FF3C9